MAVAGKGGTGKTTFAALLIQLLSRRGTVLAIDADPSTNLNMGLVVNRVQAKLPAVLLAEIAEHGLALWATLPEDPAVAGLDASGRPIAELSEDSPLRLAVAEVARKVGLVV